jgi:predicted aspartyl protease
MGTVYAEITLKNGLDVGKVREGLIKEQGSRQVVMAIVDTGAGTLVIDEATCQQLGLAIKGLRRSTLANGSKEPCKITAPVEVHTVELGAIPLRAWTSW